MTTMHIDNLPNTTELPIYKLEMQEPALATTAEHLNYVSATSLQNARGGVK